MRYLPQRLGSSRLSGQAEKALARVGGWLDGIGKSSADPHGYSPLAEAERALGIDQRLFHVDTLEPDPDNLARIASEGRMMVDLHRPVHDPLDAFIKDNKRQGRIAAVEYPGVDGEDGSMRLLFTKEGRTPTIVAQANVLHAQRQIVRLAYDCHRNGVKFLIASDVIPAFTPALQLPPGGMRIPRDIITQNQVAFVKAGPAGDANRRNLKAVSEELAERARQGASVTPVPNDISSLEFPFAGIYSPERFYYFFEFHIKE